MQGVERYKVRLLPHCEEWKEEFKEAKKQLKEIFGDNVNDIQHVGSTSINGIYAKPILDIAIVLKSFEDMNIEGMKRAGYDYCGPQNNKKNRYLFVLRGEEEISLRHVHCYEPNNVDFYFMTRFRDFLNGHEEYAKEYNDLKISLAKQYPDDRIIYTDKKESFVKMIYQKIDLKKYKSDIIK
ncbi:dephospho-CoA kinase/protein folding accessory domain-containing protein [Clostridium ragsdalei P11]|uniref:Dephospho-CoA kinase/protein folding accessory domain-containing protein n=1 Tax=Clostridium ragsdalei P11 TaxID=1353534 RepID=A0A1A6AWV1_9CLOT|nr:GrpB family protein [Clostridium ragsdalei]OBR94513.1 dephospho-CoA kinase/protein folding accessory domain-containing protein [Clostridium ragsdalei P11]